MILSAGLAWFALVLVLLARALRQFRAYRNAEPIKAPWLGADSGSQFASTGSHFARQNGGPGLGSRSSESLDRGSNNSPTPGASPSVAVVVPARNEINNIDACLAALCAQREVRSGYSMIVVDDVSDDGTAAAVRDWCNREPRVALISSGPLPKGWLGKPHACWQGAIASDSEWLCFIDADVRATPTLIATAVQTAEAKGLDMVSLYPFQELGSFWERLIIPVGMLFIACAKDWAQASNPAHPEANANGQFLLIRRNVYYAVGGHAAVCGAICEDKALAGRTKQLGYRFGVIAGERLASTRMYAGLRSLWQGFSKNAVDIMGDGSSTVLTAACALLVSWAVLTIPIVLAVAATSQPSPASLAGLGLAATGSGIALGMQAGTFGHFKVSLFYVLLFPLGATTAAILSFRSVILRRRRQVTWKGRHYQLE